MKISSFLSKHRIFSGGRISITIKALVFTLVIGLGVGMLLDLIQSDSIQKLFFSELAKELETQAREHRLLFDHHLRSYQHAAKLIISQQRFQNYISHAPWLNHEEPPLEHHYRLPPWLPPSSIMQAFFKAKFAILLNRHGHPQEIYHHFPEEPAESLLKDATLLQKFGHNQTYMTNIDDIPYVVTAQPVSDDTEQVIATLMLASPIDDIFLIDAVGEFINPDHMFVALVGKDPLQILASNDLELLPKGTLISDLKERYLVTGTSFFDYGESDLKAGFTSMITTEKAYQMANHVLGEIHKQRIVFAAVLIASFALLTLWIARRIKHTVKKIARFSKESLGIKICQRGDEVDKIVISFEQIKESIENAIQRANAIAQGNYLTETERHSKKDKLGRALSYMSRTLQSQQQTLVQLNNELEKRVIERTHQLEVANQAINALNDKLKAENLRMGAELDITRKLQQMVLPKENELKRITELDIAGFMEPATEVGGDYYDVLQHDNGLIKIGIGDVTGHGLESGLLMFMVQTAVRTLLTNHVTDSKAFLNILNRTIYENIQRMDMDKNLTLSLLDYQEGILHLSGQHEDVLVVRNEGHVEVIDTLDLGFMVGIKADITSFISQLEIKLNLGDSVILYTDGLTEAQNLNSEQYGVNRLRKVVSGHWNRSALEIQRAVIADVRQHIGQEEVRDDITLVVLKRVA